MAAAGKSHGARIPLMRQAISDCIVREGAGLSQLEVEAVRPGPMQDKANVAALSTKRHIAHLRECLELLEILEAGGRP